MLSNKKDCSHAATNNSHVDRTIKSFVRRERRITKNQRHAFENLFSTYSISHNDYIPTILTQNIPIILEIGFGKGELLLSMAEYFPEYFFIGIEVYRPGIGSLLNQLHQKQLNNVRIFCEEALYVLQHYIPNQSLSRVHLFFPDPWPKRKHHKRRLIQHTFVECIQNKLKLNGIFHIKTDWEDYAQEISKILSGHPNFEIDSTEDLFTSYSLGAISSFEKRAQRLGHFIWNLKFLLRDP